MKAAIAERDSARKIGSKSHKRKRIRVPDEVIFMIIAACTNSYELKIMQMRKKPRHGKDISDCVKIMWLPDLAYLKLVNRRFYNQVWPVLLSKFEGKLWFDSPDYQGGHDVITCVNKLFKVDERLRTIACRVRYIYDSLEDMDASSKLQFKLFPALKLIDLMAPNVDYDVLEEFTRYEECVDGDVSLLDSEILTFAAQAITNSPSMSIFINDLRHRGAKARFRYHIWSNYGVWAASFCVDITQPEAMFIVRRAHYYEDPPESEEDEAYRI